MILNQEEIINDPDDDQERSMDIRISLPLLFAMLVQTTIDMELFF